MVVAHTTGTILADEDFPDTTQANAWLEGAFASGRFGVPEKWFAQIDEEAEHADLSTRAVYMIEEQGLKTYFVTGQVNGEPI